MGVYYELGEELAVEGHFTATRLFDEGEVQEILGKSGVYNVKVTIIKGLVSFVGIAKYSRNIEGNIREKLATILNTMRHWVTVSRPTQPAPSGPSEATSGRKKAASGRKKATPGLAATRA